MQKRSRASVPQPQSSSTLPSQPFKSKSKPKHHQLKQQENAPNVEDDFNENLEIVDHDHDDVDVDVDNNNNSNNNKSNRSSQRKSHLTRDSSGIVRLSHSNLNQSNQSNDGNEGLSFDESDDEGDGNGPSTLQELLEEIDENGNENEKDGEDENSVYDSDEGDDEDEEDEDEGGDDEGGEDETVPLPATKASSAATKSSSKSNKVSSNSTKSSKSNKPQHTSSSTPTAIIHSIPTMPLKERVRFQGKQNIEVVENLAEQSDSEDEKGDRNRIGNVPLEWYKDLPHIGYDVSGKKLIRRPKGDQLDDFLKRMDDPERW